MTLDYAVESSTDESDEYGPVTSLYRSVWDKFQQGDATAVAMSTNQHDGSIRDISPWLASGFSGEPESPVAPFRLRDKVRALVRMTEDYRHDSLSRSVSPHEAAIILHRCTLLQCIGQFAGSMRGMAYGMAFAPFGRHEHALSRILHGLHEHDSFLAMASIIDKGQVDPSFSRSDGFFDAASCNVAQWWFHEPRYQHLCDLPYDSTDIEQCMSNGTAVRPKKTESRAIIQQLLPATLGAFDLAFLDQVPTHEVCGKRKNKLRQVVPSVSWAKLQAMAKIWRRRYSRIMPRESVARMAESMLVASWQFRRKFILRLIDAGYDASFAAAAFTAVMEHGLCLRPVGAFVMSQNVMPCTSLWHELADYRETPTKQVCTYGPWLDKVTEMVESVVANLYVDMRRRYDQYANLRQAITFTTAEWIASGLLFFLPIPPSYVKVYGGLLSSTESHDVCRKGGE